MAEKKTKTREVVEQVKEAATQTPNVQSRKTSLTKSAVSKAKTKTEEAERQDVSKDDNPSPEQYATDKVTETGKNMAENLVSGTATVTKKVTRKVRNSRRAKKEPSADGGNPPTEDIPEQPQIEATKQESQRLEQKSRKIQLMKHLKPIQKSPLPIKSNRQNLKQKLLARINPKKGLILVHVISLHQSRKQSVRYAMSVQGTRQLNLPMRELSRVREALKTHQGRLRLHRKVQKSQRKVLRSLQRRLKKLNTRQELRLKQLRKLQRNRQRQLLEP